MLTPTQITLVEQSFARLVPIAEIAAKLFYARLFEIAPDLRGTLFRQVDMAAQRKKLILVLALAVKSLRQPDALLPMLRDLGRRHVRYGVLDEHYDTVGLALLWTVERTVGGAFTPEAREAWRSVYALVADTMKAGALGAERALTTREPVH
jgi:hemoglobin-like flavoprotein